MKTFFKILLIISIAISIISMAATVAGAVYISQYSDSRVDESVLQINQISAQTSFYYYNFDDRLSRIGEAIKIEDAYIDSGVKYKFVPYDKIPTTLVNAFVAIEDKRFSQHHGIDYKRSIKAVFNYILGGKSTFGGSTITQQLVKNLTGNDGFSVSRKLSEAFAAMDIEKKYDKTQIMEMYLNIINLSRGCRGVGAAAEYFYSKTPDKLTLDECATIAAITNNPTIYDPSRYPEKNMQRRNLILKCMLDQGYINQRDYQDAVNAPIKLNLSKAKTSDHVNSWYIDMVINDVIEDLCKKYDMSRENASLMLYRGGYKIYTAMDHGVQQILDEYYSDIYNFPVDSEGNMAQSSMIVIDPYTSDILGVAGAVGQKKGNRIQNYATDSKRPSGSAIKPISVYAPAFEKGIINWSTIICDSPVREATESSKAWPSNANNVYIGDVTIKYAIQNSLNTVAVKVLNMYGRRESFDFLTHRLKIRNLDPVKDMGEASLALGQHSNGITLRELTSSYSIFAEGMASVSRSYFKVTDTEGRIILDNPLDQEFAISPENAAIMTKLLQAVVTSGTASGKINLTSRCEVAGKTGTTQNNFDRYFVGYTPDILAGVWFGYEYPRPLREFGGNFAITVWDEVMQQIYSLPAYEKFKSQFTIPESIGKLTYNIKTGEPPKSGESAMDWEEGWFLQQNK
jgi:penicillin-binding protein 1A